MVKHLLYFCNKYVVLIPHKNIYFIIIELTEILNVLKIIHSDIALES